MKGFIVKHLKFQPFLKTFSRIKICKCNVIISNNTHESIQCVQKIATIQKMHVFSIIFSQKVGTIQNIHVFFIISSQ